MKNRVLKLIKRLNKATVNELVPILGATQGELVAILDELVNEQLVEKRVDKLYFYKEPQKKSKLPLFFEYHERDEIELIKKGFCAEIEDYKMMFLSNKSFSIHHKFINYFRQRMYLKQHQRLHKHFECNPKTPCCRCFYDKVFYFYIYDEQVFVSKNKLNSIIEKPFLK